MAGVRRLAACTYRITLDLVRHRNESRQVGSQLQRSSGTTPHDALAKHRLVGCCGAMAPIGQHAAAQQRQSAGIMMARLVQAGLLSTWRAHRYAITTRASVAGEKGTSGVAAARQLAAHERAVLRRPACP